MIPVIPTVVVALIAFFAASFVLLRIILPVLPPSPFSKKVSPSEFGLPNFRELSLLDKCHIWLAGLDIVALILLVWQAVADYTNTPNPSAEGLDPGSAIRIWLVLTLRPTFLVILLAITLLHVRLGRPVEFGFAQWMVLAPSFVIILASTAFAAVLAATGLRFPIGLVAYSSTLCLITAAVFFSIIYTLMNIKRNLAALHPSDDSWPPITQMMDQPRPSFATEEIDALRDGGASWITSDAGSRRPSVSEWSFTTTKNAPSIHGGRPQSTAHPTAHPRSSYWFKTSTPDAPDVPPVPPLPSPYTGPLSPTAEALREEDPFRREIPHEPEHLGRNPRWRLGSQTSWLTSTDGAPPTASAWSWSHNASTVNVASHLLTSTAVSRSGTPAMAEAQVLGGYGCTPSAADPSHLTSFTSDSSVNISLTRSLFWLVSFFLPTGLSIPYLVVINDPEAYPSGLSVLFIVATALPSLLLALNMLLRSPLPIPLGLFDSHQVFPSRPATPATVVGRFSHEYKRSMSTCATVVEGRRSGDVWIAKGEAVEGKSRLGRAVEMLHPNPKLSVLPPESDDEGDVPTPIRDNSSPPISVHNTPRSDHGTQFGRLRKESKASSYYSGVEESVGHAARIMIAHRHYSSLAQTYKVSSSPEHPNAVNLEAASANSSDVEIARRSSAHLRSRSISSIIQPGTPTKGESFYGISPPPSFPLPPTPPNVRAARLAQLKHKKSFSSGYSFGQVNNMNEIDALTAGVLPLLVPGLVVGEDIMIKEGKYSPPLKYKATEKKKAARIRDIQEFGGDLSSPQFHSTPARARTPRPRKNSAFKHFSLPSLGLGKEILAAWTADVGRAIDAKAGQYIGTPRNVELNYRNTVFGADSIPTSGPNTLYLPPATNSRVSRSVSTRRLGLRPEVPHTVEGSARNSMVSLHQAPPPSAASTATFVEFGPGFDSGPQAESTPQNIVLAKRRGGSQNTETPGRSSISYIKSGGPSAVVPLTPGSKAGRVRPKKGSKPSPLNSSITPPSVGSENSGGLRPLSLLRTLDTNVDSSGEEKSLKKIIRRAGKEHNHPGLNFKQLRLDNTENADPFARSSRIQVH